LFYYDLLRIHDRNAQTYCSDVTRPTGATTQRQRTGKELCTSCGVLNVQKEGNFKNWMFEKEALKKPVPHNISIINL
jgi:hypothetical protein